MTNEEAARKAAYRWISELLDATGCEALPPEVQAQVRRIAIVLEAASREVPP